VKLPKLAAQYAIGPALGEYYVSAALQPMAGATLLRPMVGGPNANPTLLDLSQPIEDIVKQRSQNQCGAGQRTCWGDPARNKAYWYICCENTQNCNYDPSGYPSCT